MIDEIITCDDGRKYRCVKTAHSTTYTFIESAKEQPKGEIPLKTAIGALRSIVYSDAQTWTNCSSREVAKQGLLDCGGEKYPDKSPPLDTGIGKDDVERAYQAVKDEWGYFPTDKAEWHRVIETIITHLQIKPMRGIWL